MRRLPFLLICLYASALSAPAQRPAPTPPPSDLTTLSGRTYHHARVQRVEPDGITYFYDGGMSKIDFTDLPEAVRQQYGYDPAKARAFAVADDDAQASNYWAAQAQQQAAAQKRQADAESQAKRAVSAPGSEFVGNPLDAGREGGLQHFSKLSAAQVAASPFSLKGTLVEMVGIEKVEPKEIAAGVYRLSIWAQHYEAMLTAVLPARQAQVAERAKSLIVTVKTPDASPVELTILGNATDHEGLSTIPHPVWK